MRLRFSSQSQLRIRNETECAETLDLNSCSSIKRLEYHSEASHSLIRLLPLIGSTLESLQVYCKDASDELVEPDESDAQNSEEMLDVIQKHYKCLDSIYIKSLEDLVWHVGGQRVGDFLCSFGHRLISANIEGLGAEELFSVTEKCTSL